MVSKLEMSYRNRELASEHKSDIVAATRKGSRSSPERKRSMDEHMDHGVSVLASRLEEEFACVSSTASPKFWYNYSGPYAHITGVQECFSNYR